MATLSERITTLRHSGYQTSEIAAILDVTPAEVHIHDVDPASPDPVESGSGLPSNVLTKTTNFTAAAGDLILADATGGAFTITLPTGAAAGDAVLVKKTDASANAVAVAGTIDGDAGGMSITAQYFGAIFLSTGSDAWQRASVTEAGAVAGDDTIELFFFGVGDAPALAPGTVAGTAAVDGAPGYYKTAGQVFGFGAVGIASDATERADILSESLPFLLDLPSGYQMAAAIADANGNSSSPFTLTIREAGQPVKPVKAYFYHDDPPYPDGWYFTAPDPAPSGTFAIDLAGIHYPVAAT